MKQIKNSVIGIVVAAVLAVAAPLSASATSRTTAEIHSASTPSFSVVSSGSDYVLLAAQEGSFQVSPNGTVSVVDTLGNEMYPVSARGLSASGTTVSATYELVGENLKISSQNLHSEAPMISARGGITWGCVIAYLGLISGTVGFIIATGGTATVFVLGGASYAISVAGLLASC